MPERAPTLCLTPGCNQPTTTTRCPTHTQQTSASYHNPTHAKVYNSKRWRILRHRVLTEQPWCDEPDCLALAKHVDHIVGLRDGGAPFDRNNVHGLCVSHHSAKTALEVSLGH